MAMDDTEIEALARRLLGYRERAAALAAGRVPPPRSMAEAIERDFLAFDISRTERALRAAISAADPAAGRRSLSQASPRQATAEMAS